MISKEVQMMLEDKKKIVLDVFRTAPEEKDLQGRNIPKVVGFCRKG